MSWPDYYRFRYIHTRGGGPPVIPGLQGTVVNLGVPFGMIVSFGSGLRHIRGATPESIACIPVIIGAYLLACIAEEAPRFGTAALAILGGLGAVGGLITTAAVLLIPSVTYPFWIPLAFSLYLGAIARAAVIGHRYCSRTSSAA